MSIKRIELGGSSVKYLIRNGIRLYDLDAERLNRNLKLWVAGLDDYIDRSPMKHTVTASGTGPIEIDSGLHIRNKTWLEYPNDLGYVDKFSSMAWFRHVGSANGNNHIVFGGAQLEMSIHTSDILRCGLHIDGKRHVYNHGHPTKSLLDGQWHHVGFTFDGTSMCWYIDGDKVGRKTPPSGKLTSNYASRRTGRFGSSGGYGLYADLFDLRIYSDAKDDDFFLRHYNEIDMSTVRRICDYRSNALR